MTLNFILYNFLMVDFTLHLYFYSLVKGIFKYVVFEIFG